MKAVLMVAEKPSLAQSIAKILSNGHMNSRKGFNGACSVHEFNGTFQGNSVKFKMTSVCGHVMALDFHHKYNNWDAVDPVELFSAGTLKKEANPKLNMVKFLEHEAKGVDAVVLWLDCDKEGENICFEVLDSVEPMMNKPRSNQQVVFRAKFSAITEKDIKIAMNSLIQPDLNQAQSVDARQELDLRIGCAFTRFQTKYFQGKYGDLDSSLISYGPCQTPTLCFCVQRHDRITSFKPEPFWVLQVKVEHSAGQMFMLDWERVRVFDKDVAVVYYNKVNEINEVVVESVSKKEKVKQRPQALHTVEMMRIGSSALGMGPQHTMQIAETLYIQGYISYPRTETTHYPEMFDLKGTLVQLQGGMAWGANIRELLQMGLQTPRKGHDAGDHPPITPMKLAREADLSGDAWRLYDYITRHFIATLSPDCKYLQTKIAFTAAEEAFSCSGKTPIDPGFTSVMPWAAIPADESLPSLKKGAKCNINEVKVAEKQTTPPDYLTESELITLMEKHGIGTDASISVHINNICQRNYVQLHSGRRLLPTSLGIVLVHGYQKIDQELVLPTMRSSVEGTLNLIAQGKANFDDVLSHTIEIFSKKYSFFEKCITNMDELFEVSFTKLADSGKALSRCGKCVRYMKLVSAKPIRLHCSHCDETYSLPQNGTIKLYKELKCPLDDFELVVCSTGAHGKATPICPYCYNNPPFPGMKKGMGCPECLHPTCKFSPASLSVGPCLTCEDGMLVMDPMSAPKWKMACNKCNMVIHVFEDAFNVALADEGCQECGASFVNVVFHKTKSQLPGTKTEHSGCVFCDPVLIPLVKVDVARGRHPMFRRGRGRGRGRGGGRRGRGRGKPKDKMAQLDAYFL